MQAILLQWLTCYFQNKIFHVPRWSRTRRGISAPGAVPRTCPTLYCHVTNISANKERNGIRFIVWIIEVDSVRNLWPKIHPHSERIIRFQSQTRASPRAQILCHIMQEGWRNGVYNPPPNLKCIFLLIVYSASKQADTELAYFFLHEPKSPSSICSWQAHNH